MWNSIASLEIMIGVIQAVIETFVQYYPLGGGSRSSVTQPQKVVKKSWMVGFKSKVHLFLHYGITGVGGMIYVQSPHIIWGNDECGVATNLAINICGVVKTIWLSKYIVWSVFVAECKCLISRVAVMWRNFSNGWDLRPYYLNDAYSTLKFI